MRPKGILETILYVNDLEEASWFYREVLGLRMPRGEPSSLAGMFRVSENHVLLLFDPSVSDRPGRDVPSHGARGPGHIAFQIDPETYDDWLKQLSAFGIGVEQEITWGEDDGFDHGRSIYCRDPYGNSVELITADIWRGPRNS